MTRRATTKAPKPAWRRWLRRLLIGVGALVVALALFALVLYLVIDQPRPHGESSDKAHAEAAALVTRMWRATDHAAWLRTGAVRWTFRGARRHLWDRTRQLVQVRWGETEVLLRTASKRGRAFVGGAAVHGAARDKLLAKAYRMWINDAFWLNPLRTLHDRGVALTMAKDSDGKRGLLVRYGGAGGVTPGDAYLWFVDAKTGLPTAFRMWVSIIPLGGLRVSWSGWKRLSTGARVATHHEAGPLTLTLTDVAGAATLRELLAGKPDPFARL